MNKPIKTLFLAGVCALGLAACSTNGQVRTSGYYQHSTIGAGVYIDPHYSGYYYPRYQTYRIYPNWRHHGDRRWHHRYQHDRRHENRLRPIRPGARERLHTPTHPRVRRPD